MSKNDREREKLTFSHRQADERKGENTNNWDHLPNTHICGVRLSPFSLSDGQTVRMAMRQNALLFVKEGCLILEIQASRYDVRAGQLALLPRGARIICHLPRGQKADAYLVCFLIDTQKRDLFERFDLTAENHVVTLSDPDAFFSLYKEATQNTFLAEKAFPIYQCGIVMHLIALYLNARMTAENTPPAPFLPVIEYMQSHLGKDISVPELAGIACMSPEHFIRRFRQVFSCPPIKYYDKLRIRKAAHLLAFSDMPVHEIGAKVGIFDAPHFARFFRNACGMPPSQYRALFLKDADEQTPELFPAAAETDMDIDLIPGNIFLLHPNGFWLEDKAFYNDRMFRPIEGSFAYLTDTGKLHIIRDNRVSFFPEGRRVRYTLTDAQALSYYRLDMTVLTNGEDLFRRYGLLEEPLFASLPRATLWNDICFHSRFNDAFRYDIAYHLFRTASMTKLAALYVDAKEHEIAACRDEFVQAVGRFMREHPFDNLSVSDIAGRFEIETSYFIRKFKKVCGCTPKKYYDQLRAEAAADMLLQTDVPVRTVVKKLGFSSINYFSAFFAERIGVSPEEYRRLYKLLCRTGATSSKDEILS